MWHSSLTQENVADLERVQKSAVKIILQDKYKYYRKSLNFLDIPTLSERCDQLSLSFAKKCLKNPQTKDMFPLNKKSHNIETRNCEKYLVEHANTDRLKTSSIIFMQRMLNENEKKNVKT